MLEQITRWLLLVILIGSSISLVVVYQLDYIAEALVARAIPLALVVGLSAIATSIMFRKQ
ncbi:hypothetical protein P9B03_16950 [Metasolibacillus meyeri]|uniref:Uncharacterized protein n=1 Tax=Metasolibacillus meyeri TaxID=1071052 RepID=A0AAW9NV88_9BACL|nr:hypothetical protein [Metasolibacillus meyeri]MEC1180193.1 hypothetical protein [Metasolibacillus meyeri]